MMSHARGAFALLACCLFATAAGAANVVLNSDLESNVISWMPESSTSAIWSTDDARGSFDSGSIQVGNSHPNANNGVGVRQCLPVIPIRGTVYEFGGKAKIPGGQARTGSAYVGTRFYEGAHCTGAVVGSQPRRSTTVIDSWVELVRGAQEIPAGANSVLFLAFPSKVEAGGTLVARFDDLFFEITMPFKDGFETGNSSAWAQTVPAVITAVPYVDKTKIQGISRVFCKSGFCPWVPPDAPHDGLDLTPTEDRVAFQASCDGEVFSVDPFPNQITGLYQVNVGIACGRDNTHGVVYAFEPASAAESDRDLQMDNIEVEVGDLVSPGDLIGHLVRANPGGAHVHYGVFLLGPIGQICPAPLFSTEVTEDLLEVVHIDHPGWGFCH